MRGLSFAVMISFLAVGLFLTGCDSNNSNAGEEEGQTLTNYEIVRNSMTFNVTNPPDALSVGVDCPSGAKVFGGGGSITEGETSELTMVASVPSEGPGPSGWEVVWQVGMNGGREYTVDVFAICAVLN